MQKDELIQMHALLVQIKNKLVSDGATDEGAFQEYNDLGISPVHVHRSKGDHKRAIFLLGSCLANFTKKSEAPEHALLGHNFAILAGTEKRAASVL